jgi:hypothetical protein
MRGRVWRLLSGFRKPVHREPSGHRPRPLRGAAFDGWNGAKGARAETPAFEKLASRKEARERQDTSPATRPKPGSAVLEA